MMIQYLHVVEPQAHIYYAENMCGRLDVLLRASGLISATVSPTGMRRRERTAERSIQWGHTHKYMECEGGEKTF